MYSSKFDVWKMPTIPFQLYPIGSMYAIYGNIYHQYTPVMLALIYQHHGSVMGIEWNLCTRVVMFHHGQTKKNVTRLITRDHWAPGSTNGEPTWLFSEFCRVQSSKSEEMWDPFCIRLQASLFQMEEWTGLLPTPQTPTKFCAIFFNPKMGWSNPDEESI